MNGTMEYIHVYINNNINHWQFVRPQNDVDTNQFSIEMCWIYYPFRIRCLDFMLLPMANSSSSSSCSFNQFMKNLFANLFAFRFYFGTVILAWESNTLTINMSVVVDEHWKFIEVLSFSLLLCNVYYIRTNTHNTLKLRPFALQI